MYWWIWLVGEQLPFIEPDQRNNRYTMDMIGIERQDLVHKFRYEKNMTALSSLLLQSVYAAFDVSSKTESLTCCRPWSCL